MITLYWFYDTQLKTALFIFFILLTFFLTAIIHFYIFLERFFERWPLFIFTVCGLGKGDSDAPCMFFCVSPSFGKFFQYIRIEASVKIYFLITESFCLFNRGAIS